MNPLSAWTFYRRHKQRTALLLGIICAGTVGLYLLSALSLAIFYTPDLMAVVIAVVIGVINQIALAKRLPEFGILHATGYSKKWLTLAIHPAHPHRSARRHQRHDWPDTVQARPRVHH